MRERVYVFNPHQTNNIFFTPTTHKIEDFLKPNQYYYTYNKTSIVVLVKYSVANFRKENSIYLRLVDILVCLI